MSDAVAPLSAERNDLFSRLTKPFSTVLSRTGSLFDRLHDLPLILVFLAMIGGISVVHPEYLNRYSLINIGTEAAYFGTMALGMVFLLSMREIDLSVGSIFGLTIIVVAHLIETGVQPWLAALVGVAVGPILGAVNGLIANALRIQTIIVTLGTLSVYRSFALILSQDMVLEHNLPTHDSYFQILGGLWLGVPVSIWMFVAFALILHIVYRYTRFGFNVRAIGSNPEAARLAGISIPGTRLSALVLQGLLCSVVGVVTFAYLEAGDPITGTGFELSVIAAAIIGGTALSGGQGSVFGALIGALIISTITTGLIQFGATQDWALFATGAAIVAAVALDAFLKRRRLLAAERLGASTAASPRERQQAGDGEPMTVTQEDVGAGRRP
jgi:ribose transport system permease protein